MSRSYKRTPVSGWALSESNKEAKKVNQRMMRRASRIMLHSAQDFDALVLPRRLDEMMDRWDYPDDGKTYFGERNGHRFTVENPKRMRK